MIPGLLASLLFASAGATAIAPDATPIGCDNCADWNQPQAPFRIFGKTCYLGIRPHRLHRSIAAHERSEGRRERTWRAGAARPLNTCRNFADAVEQRLDAQLKEAKAGIAH